MDTRFWGPSGWSLLHQITFAYEPSKQKKAAHQLFTMLPFVLPCKFCRASLTEYMEEDPLSPAVLETREALSEWFYRIHNQVNAKLRKQGQPVADDPSFDSVRSFYLESLASGCTRTFFSGWNFLFSVAENHPLARTSLNSSPMPDAPQRSPGLSWDDLNRHNLLKPAERFRFYSRFWKVVGPCLPFSEWRDLWNSAERKVGLRKAVRTRSGLVRALWKIRCILETAFDLVNRTKFADLCDTLAEHRSGCSRSKRAITCRKPMRSRTKTLKA
jgi:hypothetical protein